MLVEHPLKPIYNSESEVLILGTMPSKKSRELGFYYDEKELYNKEICLLTEFCSTCLDKQ